MKISILNWTVSLILLLIIGLMHNISIVYASSSTTVTFTTGDILLDNTFTVRLDLRISVTIGSGMLFSDGSADVKVNVKGGSATIYVTYQGNTYYKDFITPIGSIKIPIYDVILGTIYAKITGSVETTPQINGKASITPSELSWTTSSTKTLKVTHKGSVFSFDTITVKLPLKYVLSIAVGIESLGAVVFEYSADVGSLTGTPTVTQTINTISLATISIFVMIIIGIVAVAVARKRKPSPSEGIRKEKAVSIKEKPIELIKEHKMPEKIYCRYCGTKNDVDAIFCKNCGKKIRD